MQEEAGVLPSSSGETAETRNGESSENQLGWTGVTILAGYLIILAPLMIYLLAKLWVSDVPKDVLGGTPYSSVILGMPFNVSLDVRILLLIAVAGALGSHLITVMSLAKYALDNRRPTATWALWCILQPWIGSVLAIIFFWLYQTTMATGTSPGTINLSFVIGLAALVGMFTKQATEKLRRYFAGIDLGGGGQSSTENSPPGQTSGGSDPP